MDKKLQIREINDIQGNRYKIYDVMFRTKFGLWKSVCTLDTLEDAIIQYPNIHIEDLTK